MQIKKMLSLIKSRTKGINKVVTHGDANIDSFVTLVLICIRLF
jgi:hypothetical protein